MANCCFQDRASLIESFNNKSVGGMVRLIHEGLLPDNPRDISLFLHTKGLRKRLIGHFLGETNDENRLAFVEQFDFTSIDFLQALRIFLSSFGLPEDLTKIRAILESFSIVYYAQNPNCSIIFENAESCFLLSYSVVMLNSDMSSPTWGRRKMTLNEFIVDNSGKNGGHDFDRVYLENIYNELHAHPFELVCTPYGEVKKQGFLRKKGSLFWTKLWFLLTTDNYLYYFKDKESVHYQNPQGYFNVENVNLETNCSNNKYLMEISSDGQALKAFQYDKSREAKEETCNKLLLVAPSIEEMEDWCESLVGNFKITNASNTCKSAQK